MLSGEVSGSRTLPNGGKQTGHLGYQGGNKIQLLGPWNVPQRLYISPPMSSLWWKSELTKMNWSQIALCIKTTFPKFVFHKEKFGVIGVKIELHSYSSGEGIHLPQELSLQEEFSDFQDLLKTRILSPRGVCRV